MQSLWPRVVAPHTKIRTERVSQMQINLLGQAKSKNGKMICPPNEALNTLRKLISVDTDDCVLWPYAHSENGYGRVEVDGILRGAHIVAWAFAHNAPIPQYKIRNKNTLNVLHTCDVRGCINPKHLFRGTQKENILDMIRKGRWATGKAHRLTHEKVHEVRALVSKGMPSSEIAKMYGLTYVSVYRIATRRSYPNL